MIANPILGCIPTTAAAATATAVPTTGTTTTAALSLVTQLFLSSPLCSPIREPDLNDTRFLDPLEMHPL